MFPHPSPSDRLRVVLRPYLEGSLWVFSDGCLLEKFTNTLAVALDMLPRAPKTSDVFQKVWIVSAHNFVN